MRSGAELRSRAVLLLRSLEARQRAALESLPLGCPVELLRRAVLLRRLVPLRLPVPERNDLGRPPILLLRRRAIRLCIPV